MFFLGEKKHYAEMTITETMGDSENEPCDFMVVFTCKCISFIYFWVFRYQFLGFEVFVEIGGRDLQPLLLKSR